MVVLLASTTKALHEQGLVKLVNHSGRVAALLIVPKPSPAMFRMAVGLRPPNLAAENGVRPMPNMISMPQETKAPVLLAKQTSSANIFNWTSTQMMHTFTVLGVDSQSLHVSLPALQGYKNSGIHLQVQSKES